MTPEDFIPQMVVGLFFPRLPCVSMKEPAGGRRGGISTGGEKGEFEIVVLSCTIGRATPGRLLSLTEVSPRSDTSDEPVDIIYSVAWKI